MSAIRRPGRIRCAFRKTISPTTDPSKTPRNIWKAHGHLLIGNWINKLYQTAPFDIEEVGRGK